MMSGLLIKLSQQLHQLFQIHTALGYPEGQPIQNLKKVASLKLKTAGKQLAYVCLKCSLVSWVRIHHLSFLKILKSYSTVPHIQTPLNPVKYPV